MKHSSACLMLCALLPLAAAAAEPEPLGRLFYTPAERTGLDQLRRNGPDLPATKTTALAPEPVDERLTVNGIVRSSSGGSTAWVNDKAVPQARIIDRHGKPALLLDSAGGSKVAVQPGQTLDNTTGTLNEGNLSTALKKSRVPAP